MKTNPPHRNTLQGVAIVLVVLGYAANGPAQTPIPNPSRAPQIDARLVRGESLSTSHDGQTAGELSCPSGTLARLVAVQSNMLSVLPGSEKYIVSVTSTDYSDPVHPPKSSSAACQLVPPPREYRETGPTTKLLGADAVTIVLGDMATPVEKYAAERLQSLIEKRFRRKLSIVTEGKEDKTGQAIIIGEIETSRLVRHFCEHGNIDLAGLAGKSESRDGFAIAVLDNGRTVLVGGSNERGTIYGAEAFFDLLRSDGDDVVFPMVTIRDWPGISWRGRHCHDYRFFLDNEALDAVVSARLNWIDVRGEPPWVFHGYSGFSAWHQFQPEEAGAITKVITRAHQRGLLVYGTICSSAQRLTAIAKILATSRKLIEFGVDGLWYSFDDSGPGRVPTEVLIRALKLAAEHGIDGYRIAIVPPIGSYQNIDTEFNRRTAAIPGMEKVTWFFTRTPCATDSVKAGEIGLKVQPAWWYNWPRTEGGFSRKDYEGQSLVAGCRPYREVPDISDGWGKPGISTIADADKYVRSASFWGIDYGDEYVEGVFGSWAWNPAGFRPQDVTAHIYTCVFGESQAGAAREYDTMLPRLRNCFLPKCDADTPRRPRDETARSEAVTLIDSMDALLQRIEKDAFAQTVLSSERLRSVYLEPMRMELRVARAGIDSPAPIRSVAHEKVILKALLLGQGTEALAECRIYQKEEMAYSAELHKVFAFLPEDDKGLYRDLLYEPPRKADRLEKGCAWLAAELGRDPALKFRDPAALVKAIGQDKPSQSLEIILNVAAESMLPDKFADYLEICKGFTGHDRARSVGITERLLGRKLTAVEQEAMLPCAIADDPTAAIRAVLPDDWSVTNHQTKVPLPETILVLDGSKVGVTEWGSACPASVYLSSTNTDTDTFAQQLGTNGMIAIVRGRKIFVHANSAATNSWPTLSQDVLKAIIVPAY